MDEQEDLSERFPLADALDHAILMHRDAHFGGKFDVMIEYYEKEGKGSHPDFELSRIKELQNLEQGTHQNLAAMMLSGPEAERIALSREAYRRLRQLYQRKKDPKIKEAILIADLILSEEEEPEKEMDAIVAEGAKIVPALLELVRSEDFHDTLFPGYGLAPALAVQCLGRIGDKRAIIALFEAIGDSDFFDENIVLDALKIIGEPAKEFLLKVVKGKPTNYDNERAAAALVAFKDDPNVAETCFELLKEIDLNKDPLFATHLILCSEGLKDEKSRKEFAQLSTRPKISSMLKRDMEAILFHWKK